jgi:predicted ribosome quality control (RQC) complex YloA/Tae2 family protein
VLDGFQRADHLQLGRDLQEARAETSRWRNLAIGGFADSTSVAQAAQTKLAKLEKRAKQLEDTLEATREKLFAVRRTNRTLQAKLDRLGAHVEVRLRRRASSILRRARGKS